MRFFGTDSFEQWLETELRNADTEPGSTVPAPRYAALEPPRHRGGGVVRLVAGLGATKSALAAGAVVALAAGGVVTGKAVTTGDPNPFDNWGRAVTQQVHTCKETLGATSQGIGQCVSGKTKTHASSVGGPHVDGQGPGFMPVEPPSPYPTGPPSSLSGAATNHPTPSPASAVPRPVVTTATPHGPGKHASGPPSPHPSPHP